MVGAEVEEEVVGLPQVMAVEVQKMVEVEDLTKMKHQGLMKQLIQILVSLLQIGRFGLLLLFLCWQHHC